MAKAKKLRRNPHVPKHISRAARILRTGGKGMRRAAAATLARYKKKVTRKFL